ncbi:hypothetical protein [Streptomyces sp. NPDC052036]
MVVLPFLPELRGQLLVVAGQLVDPRYEVLCGELVKLLPEVALECRL